MAKKTFNLELYLGIVATVIALLSVVIAVWEGVETRRHHRLSVKPILLFSKTFNITQNSEGVANKTTMTLELVNRGLGPAIIKTVSLTSPDGSKSFLNWKKALDFANYEGVVASSSDLSEGSVLDSGEKIILLSVDWLPHDGNDVQFVIHYESIYEEQFEAEAGNLLKHTL